MQLHFLATTYRGASRLRFEAVAVLMACAVVALPARAQLPKNFSTSRLAPQGGTPAARPLWSLFAWTNLFPESWSTNLVCLGPCYGGMTMATHPERTQRDE